MTDITSFSGARATTYSLLLVFYIAAVMVVVWLCGKLRRHLERRQVARDRSRRAAVERTPT
jgi:polar amino acid transport system substrate-binding protein